MASFPNKILLGLQEGSCNLQCPKCFTHGDNAPTSDLRRKGVMDFNKFKVLLDDIVRENPKARVTAQTWDEPFLTPNILAYLNEIKQRNLFCSIDTNGILLTPEISQNLIDYNVDSIFISLDAVSNSMYKKIRGVDKLQLITDNITTLIEMRGAKKFPRIGVSFVEENANQHELEDFIDQWSLKVDCIRVNEKFNQDRSIKVSKGKRYACWSLDDSMMISFDGSVGLCCIDTHYQLEIGNVFTDDIGTIWRDGFFNKARSSHHNNQFSDISICQSCDLWLNDDIIHSEDKNLLIAKSSTHTYYNRKDRLDNLTDNRFLKK